MTGKHETAGVFLAAAVFVLLLPLDLLAAMLLAMGIHEGGHYLMIRICGGVVRELRMTPEGIRMEVEGLHRWQELICALAGPVSGLMMLFFLRWLPRTAICAVCQSLFNLLPIYPLDGGRALQCGSELVLPFRVAKWVCAFVERACIIGLFVLGVYSCFWLRLGLFPFLLSGWVVLRSIQGKIPCKAGSFSLQ